MYVGLDDDRSEKFNLHLQRRKVAFLSSSCRNTHCQINKEMKRLKSQRHEQRVWLAKSVYRIFIHIVEYIVGK